MSHRSAAAMMEILPYPAVGDVWVTVALKTGGSRPGIRVHQARSLDDGSVHRLHGVPLTTPVRTLVDLAAVVDGEQDGARRREHAPGRLGGKDDLWAQLERHRGRRGAGRLRAMLQREAEPAFTRSEAERICLRLIRRARLPEPEVNARVEGREVDFVWRARRVIVEVDGYAYHSDQSAFERDRLRDSDLQLRGWVVLRVTWRELARRPLMVQDRIRAAVGARNLN